MLRLMLIRHGMTEGNRLKRYIGTTDEPLCGDGRRALEEKRDAGDYLFAAGTKNPKSEDSKSGVKEVFVSPLLRCRQTAEILFPDQNPEIIEELAEGDFGDFENKNYLELKDSPDYQAWVDSGGTLPFPNGESREEVQRRNLEGLRKVLDICRRKNINTAALVIHGGTIMNIMTVCGRPERSFYDWQVKNGCGYFVDVVKKEEQTILAVLKTF